MEDAVMDPLSLMIFIGIGNMVAWLAALYVKGAFPGLIGHVVVSTIGAAGAGHVIWYVLPHPDTYAVIGGALAGAVGLLYLTRLRRLV